MNEESRELVQRAFAALDSVDAMQAEPRPALSFDQRYEYEAAEADSFLAQCAERRRLARQPEPGERERMSLRAKVVMIEAAEKRVRAFVVAAAEALAREAGAACGKLESKIKKLEQEVAALRAEIEILRQPKTSKSDGVVSLRGSRDVA